MFERWQARKDRHCVSWTSSSALTLSFCRGSFLTKSNAYSSTHDCRARYQITASEAARFTGNLADVAHMVEPVIVRPLVLSDPADDPVLYTAADGKADVLCTRNIRHFDVAEVQSFCAARGIRVMTDLDVLRELLEHGPAADHGDQS